MIARRWFQFRLQTLLALMTAVAVGLASWPTLRLIWLVESISNNQVRVDGGNLGLMVELETPAAQQIRRYGTRANSLLFAALKDPERFAAAHVLLTRINIRQATRSGREWNGMRIGHVGHYGHDDFPRDQIPRLREYWKAQLGEH
jgi:hypothetical protein